MKRLCYGTFVTILNLCASSDRYQTKLNNAILKTIDPHGLTHDESKASRLFNCKIELNEFDIIDPVRTANKEKIADKFESDVIILLDPNKIKLAILAIRDIIADDESIALDTVIYNGISKKSLCNQKHFNKGDFFSGIFIYIVCFTKNKSGINFIKEITKEYVNSFYDQRESIQFIESDSKTHIVRCSRSECYKPDIWKAVKQDYLASREVGSRFASLNILSHLLPHGYVVHSDFIEYGKTEDGDIKPLSDILTEFADENIIVVGEGGIGKTTFLLKMMEDAYQSDFDEKISIPVFIELNHCPPQIGSWYSIKNGKTNFITRYIASQICGREFNDVPNNILTDIENEFKKENKQKSAEYTVLLDGFNEVSLSGAVNSGGEATGSSIREMLSTEIRTLMQYPNVRIIITSRKTDLFFPPDLTNAIELVGMKQEDVEAHLQDNGYNQWDINQIVASRKLMDCLRIPLFLCMFTANGMMNKSEYIQGESHLETRGEILYHFFNRSHGIYNERLNADRLNPTSVFAKKETLFILDFVLPYIGWSFEYSNSFNMDRSHILEYIEEFFSEKEIVSFWNKGIPIFHDYESETVNLSDFKNRIMAKGYKEVLDCIVNVLGAMGRDKNFSYSFVHHHIRDYFAAIYEIQLMRMAKVFYDKNRIADAFASLSLINQNVWSETKRVFIGEILNEHKNSPKPDEAGKWRLPESFSWEQDMLRLVLTIFRLAERPTYCGVLNVVETMISARGSLAGEDFSDLSMVENRLHGVNCSVGRGNNVLAANFRGTKISDDVFETEGHSENIMHFVYSKDSAYLYTMSEDNTVKRWETDTGRCINTIRIECSEMKESANLTQTDFAISNDGESFLSIGFEPLKDRIGHLCFIQQYDWKNRRIVYESSGDFHDVNTMSYSVDDQYIVAVYTYNHLRIYERDNPIPIFSEKLNEVGNIVEALVITKNLVFLIYSDGNDWWYENGNIADETIEEIIYKFAILHTENNEIEVLYTYSKDINTDDDEDIKYGLKPTYAINTNGSIVVFFENGLLKKLDIQSKLTTEMPYPYSEPNHITFIPQAEAFFAWYFGDCIRYDVSVGCETGSYCYDGLIFQTSVKDSSLRLLMDDEERNIYELNLISDSINQKYQYCRHTIMDIFTKQDANELIVTFDNDSLWVIDEESGVLLEAICFQEPDAKSCLSCYSVSSGQMVLLFANDYYEYIKCYDLRTGKSERAYFDFVDKRKIKSIFMSEDEEHLFCLYEQSVAVINLISLEMIEIFRIENTIIQAAYYNNTLGNIEVVISFNADAAMCKPRIYGIAMNNEGFFQHVYWYEVPYIEENLLSYFSVFHREVFLPTKMIDDKSKESQVLYLSSGIFLDYDENDNNKMVTALQINKHLLGFDSKESIVSVSLNPFEIGYVISDMPAVFADRMDKERGKMPPPCQLLDVSENGQTVVARLGDKELIVFQFYENRFHEVCRFSSAFEDLFKETSISGAKVGENGMIYYWVNENKLCRLNTEDGMNKEYESFVPGLSVMGCDFQDADMSDVTRFMLALHGGGV